MLTICLFILCFSIPNLSPLHTSTTLYSSFFRRIFNFICSFLSIYVGLGLRQNDGQANSTTWLSIITVWSKCCVYSLRNKYKHLFAILRKYYDLEEVMALKPSEANMLWHRLTSTVRACSVDVEGTRSRKKNVYRSIPACYLLARVRLSVSYYRETMSKRILL